MKKYQVIYADPPWRYEHAISKSREIENQYPTMLLKDIKALDIPAEKNSVLFMWTTAPKVAEALEVLLAWGFKYRTCAIWDKQCIGMGYWFRTQHEVLLVGVKGTFSPPPPAKTYLFRAQRAEGKAQRKAAFRQTMDQRLVPGHVEARAIRTTQRLQSIPEERLVGLGR